MVSRFRFPRKHRYPPSAVWYTFQRNTGQQWSDIENCDNVTKSSGKVYATVHQAVASSYDSDTQEEYDDIIKSGIGPKYQNQTRTKVVMEEEYYDDIIKSGTGTKYQNSTQTEKVTEEEYDDIIKSGTGTKYQNLTHQTEEVMEEYDDIVPH